MHPRCRAGSGSGRAWTAALPERAMPEEDWPPADKSKLKYAIFRRIKCLTGKRPKR